MATYVKGNAVPNAKEYVLLEKSMQEEIVSLGLGSQDLFTNTTTGYLAGSTTITGYVFGIGKIAADKKISGVKLAVSPYIDSSAGVENATKIYGYLYAVENLPLASNGRVAFATSVSPTLVASGSADISVANNATKNVDVIFDEPYYNTEGKFLMFGYNLDVGCKRRKASPDITGAAACEANDGNPYESLYMWYSSTTDNSGTWAPGYEDTTALAYTLLTSKQVEGDDFVETATASDINFDVSEIVADGNSHTFVVQAKGDGVNYLDSDYSNEVTYPTT